MAVSGAAPGTPSRKTYALSLRWPSSSRTSRTPVTSSTPGPEDGRRLRPRTAGHRRGLRGVSAVGALTQEPGECLAHAGNSVHHPQTASDERTPSAGFSGGARRQQDHRHLPARFQGQRLERTERVRDHHALRRALMACQTGQQLRVVVDRQRKAGEEQHVEDHPPDVTTGTAPGGPRSPWKPSPLIPVAVSARHTRRSHGDAMSRVPASSTRSAWSSRTSVSG